MEHLYLPGGAQCPWNTADLTPLSGHLERRPEDFIVDEIPAYLPSGEGSHWYVKLRKRDLTSERARDILARASGVKSRDVGMAGRKDRHGITTQWMSLPKEPVDPEDDRLEIVEVSRHRNKLKTGHVKGNTFRIRLRGGAEDVEARLPALLARVKMGVPNYFGAQRFGREPPQSMADLTPPLMSPRFKGRRNPTREVRFVASVVQSVVFNRWLGDRMVDGLLHTVLAGDVCQKRATGGVFQSEDAAVDQGRMDAGELDIMGPMIGPKTFRAAGEALAREGRAAEAVGMTDEILAALKPLAPGTRRVACLRPEGLSASVEGADLWLSFTLPSGAYATTILGALTHQSGDLRVDVRPSEEGPREGDFVRPSKDD
ncbi:MAG: tRNA pseudouridine(13) synthase TruD [Bradymonadia bacterium]